MMWLKEMWTWIQENVKLVLGVAGAAVVGLGALVFSRSKDKTIGALIDDKIDADKARADKDEQVAGLVKQFQEVEDKIRQDFADRKMQLNKEQEKHLEVKKKQYVNAKTDEERAAVVADTRKSYQALSFVPITAFAEVSKDEE